MCSITSSVSTTRRVGIRRSDISVPYSSSKLKKLRSVSTRPAAAQNCERWLNTSLQFFHLASLVLLLRRL
jgi:prephenate dehydratase